MVTTIHCQRTYIGLGRILEQDGSISLCRDSAEALPKLVIERCPHHTVTRPSTRHPMSRT